MIQTIRKAWGIPELRKKIIFTALILLIFRIGNAIPVPYVDTGLLNDYINQLSTTVLGLYNVMSGGAFAEATVFALGVQPYINSSIIIQLLTIAIPALERLAREGGEEGKKKIQSITRYATVAIAILQGWGYYMLMKNYGILTNTGVWAALVIIASFIAGSSFVMWMGEQITEFGIGNGISIILFAGIVSRGMLERIIVSGAFIAVVFMAQSWTNFMGGTAEQQSTILFTLFVVFQLFNAFNSRELGNASLFANLLRNKVMIGVFALMFALQVLVVQFGGAMFRTVPLPIDMWLKIIAVGFGVVVLQEVIKTVKRAAAAIRARRTANESDSQQPHQPIALDLVD